MVAHFVAVAFPAVILYVAITNFSFFALHPIFMTVAYGFLLNEAVQVLSPSSSLVSGGQVTTELFGKVNKQTKKVRKVNIHGYTLLGALVMALLGFAVIYWNKSSRGVPHFTTWHGSLGLATVIYTTIQVTAGIYVKYASKLGIPFGIKLAELKVYHSLSGSCLFMLSAITLLLGCYSNWYTSNTGDVLWGAGAVGSLLLFVLGLSTLATIVQTQSSRLKRSR